MHKKIILTLMALFASLLLRGCIGETNADLTYIEKTPTVSNTLITIDPKINNQGQRTPNSISSDPSGSLIPTTTVEQIEAGEQTTIPICIGSGEQTTLPQAFDLPGLLIYQDDRFQSLFVAQGNISDESLQILDFEIPVQILGFTPDGKWLAYTDRRKDNDPIRSLKTGITIMLVSDFGETIERHLETTDINAELLDDHELLGVLDSDWINNQFLQLKLWGGRTENQATSQPDELTFLLDPFVGRWLIEPLREMPGRLKGANLYFSPDLQQVLYVSEGGTALWDMGTNRLTYNDEKLIAIMLQGAWSSDSKFVAYTDAIPFYNDYDVVVIEHVGYKTSHIRRDKSTYIRDISWSPNNRYVSVISDNGENPQIILYDVVLGEYLFRCPIHGYEKGAVLKAIWAPDSSMLTYGVYGRVQKGLPQVFVLSQGITYTLNIDGNPVGWINNSNWE